MAGPRSHRQELRGPDCRGQGGLQGAGGLLGAGGACRGQGGLQGAGGACRGQGEPAEGRRAAWGRGAHRGLEPSGGSELPQLQTLLFVGLKFPDRQHEPSEARVSFPRPSGSAISWGRRVSDKL